MSKIIPAANTSRKEMIRKTATKLFRLKGYHATSMRHLAEDVGVEAASLYNHIENKAALLNEICFEVADAFNNQMNIAEQVTISQAAKVESIIRFHIKMMMERFEEMYVSMRDWKHLKEPWLSDYLQQRRLYEKRFVNIIESGIQNNEFRNVNAAIAVLTILSAVRSVEFWQRNNRNIEAADMENDLVGLLTGGLKK